LAAFQVITYGRFWVITEGCSRLKSAIALRTTVATSDTGFGTNGVREWAKCCATHEFGHALLTQNKAALWLVA
jgi:hypothetical protein